MSRHGWPPKKSCVLELNEHLDRLATGVSKADAHRRRTAFLPGFIKLARHLERAVHLHGFACRQCEPIEISVSNARRPGIMERDRGVAYIEGIVVGDRQ